MGKLMLISSFCAAVTVVLFIILVLLMTRVNPDQDPNYVTVSTKATTPSAGRRILNFTGYTTRPTAEWPKVKIKDPLNKGRRSIDDHRTTNNEGVVIMKVVNPEGKSRIEVVLYPKYFNDNWKFHKVDNFLGRKHLESESIQETMLLPEDTIVIENEESTNSLENSNIIKYEFNTESVDINSIKMSKDSQGIPKLDIVLSTTKANMPLENNFSTINTAIKINDSEEGQTIMDTDFKEKNSHNFYYSTIPDINIVSSFQNNSWDINPIYFDMQSDAKLKVNSPEPISDKNINKVTYVHTETETITTASVAEETTLIFWEELVNKATTNSFNHSVIDLISYSEKVKNESQISSEISEAMTLEVDSNNVVNNAIIKTILADLKPITDQTINKTTAILNVNTKTEKSLAEKGQTTEEFTLREDAVNNSVTTNSVNHSVIHFINYPETTEVLKVMISEVDFFYSDTVKNESHISSEITTEEFTLREDTVNNSVTTNSVNHSVVNFINYPETTEVLKFMTSEVDSGNVFIHATIKDLSDEHITYQNTDEVPAANLNTEIETSTKIIVDKPSTTEEFTLLEGTVTTTSFNNSVIDSISYSEPGDDESQTTTEI